ncbi:kinase-like domain-containing protein [Tricladium varicosporioides]|nr:kinase-like domain-containing protein [Hymenoscyphus varicosporioides]
MLEEPLTYEESHERVYCAYPDRFLKRSLAPPEYKTTRSGELYIPFRNRERLENEVACLRYIRQETDIPVPEVLGAYEKDGSFLVWTARAKGVPLNKLKNEDRLKVIPEIHKHINTLHTLRSNKTGGPSGILCPPYMVTNHCDRNTIWQQISAEDFRYVFCHRDLSGSNIIVDPVTCKITAILDWEFSGFYPKEHEIPYYEKPIPSGAQLRHFPQTVKLIKQFWEDSIYLR